MAVRIRLARAGRKNKPFYRVVVANSESPRDGRFIEILGTYDPLKQPAAVSLKKDRLESWLNQGALPSDTVKSLIQNSGVLTAAE